MREKKIVKKRPSQKRLLKKKSPVKKKQSQKRSLKKQPILGTVITGASSGIGLAFAEHYASIQEAGGKALVLVSSNNKKLTEAKRSLSKKHPKLKIFSRAIDLSLNKAAEEVLKFCDSKQVRIEVLVNNAGVGYIGAFYKISQKRLDELMLLNMNTLTKLSHIFLGRMKRQSDSGVLLNIASTAAFQSIPYFSVYAATKAYVVNLTVALAEEYRRKPVQILAVCPGPTETQFMSRALREADDSKLREISQKMMSRQAGSVVETTMKAVNAGKQGIHIDGYKNKWILRVSHLLPYKLKVRITATLFDDSVNMENPL